MYIYVQVLPCLFFCVHVRACVWMITCVLLRRLPLVSWWEAEQLGVKQLSLTESQDIPVIVLPTPIQRFCPRPHQIAVSVPYKDVPNVCTTTGHTDHKLIHR